LEKIAFYILWKKGYMVLKAIYAKFSTNQITFVVCGRDSGVDKDWYNDSSELCTTVGVNFLSRGDNVSNMSNSASISFARGWRWMINGSEKLIVLHDSLLPLYRGFASLVNMLINGEKEIGVTAILASDEYDKGPILDQKSISIVYPKKIAEAIDDIIPLYEVLVTNICQKILATETISYIDLDERGASYSLRRSLGDCFINWAWSADKIERFVNSVGYPYKGAVTYANGKLVWIIEATSISDLNVEDRNLH
jgi:methionyl-tRNA formyltransferase